MGEVGNFFLGGSKTKTKQEQEAENASSNSSAQQSTSTQTSNNSSAQGSLSSSNNAANSKSYGYNSAYAPISQAMSPTLGMTAAGGNMLGALLGVPGYSATGGPNVKYATTQAPPSVSLPAPAVTPSANDLLAGITAALAAAVPPPATAPPAPVVAPPPVAPPPVVAPPPAAPPPVVVPPPSTHPFGPGGYMPSAPASGPATGTQTARPSPRSVSYAAGGGAVGAGQPVVVGEKRPEVFVPNQDGVILPSVPGATSTGGLGGGNNDDGMMHTMTAPPGATTGGMGGQPNAPHPPRYGNPFAAFQGSSVSSLGSAIPPQYLERFGIAPGTDLSMLTGTPQEYQQQFRDARRDYRHERPKMSDYGGDYNAYHEAKTDWRDGRPTMQSFIQSLLNPAPPVAPPPAAAPPMGVAVGEPNPAAVSYPPMEGRALGGPVSAGTPYVVGENRPETFVPTGRDGGGGGLLMQSMFGGAASGGGYRPPPTARPRPGTSGPITPGGFPVTPPLAPPAGGVPPVTPPLAPPAGGVPPVAAAPPAAPALLPGHTPQGDALTTWADSAGMNYLRNEGTRAIEGSGAYGGTLQSGNTGIALQKLGVGLASQYQNDYIRNLLEFSKLGLGGASAMSGAGGVTGSGSGSSGSSNAASLGGSQGTSSGVSQSTGSSQGTATGSSSGETTTKGNSKNGLLPALAPFAAAAASDPRLKTNVVKVGQEADGLNVYEWDYRQDTSLDLPTERQRGVMANEVAVLRPWAYIPNFSKGYAGVDYGKLGGSNLNG